MPITEDQMPYETMGKRVDSHICAQCGSRLGLAWGGTCYILRCGKDLAHDTIEPIRQSAMERAQLKMLRGGKE